MPARQAQECTMRLQSHTDEVVETANDREVAWTRRKLGSAASFPASRTTAASDLDIRPRGAEIRSDGVRVAARYNQQSDGGGGEGGGFGNGGGVGFEGGGGGGGFGTGGVGAMDSGVGFGGGEGGGGFGNDGGGAFGGGVRFGRGDGDGIDASANHVDGGGGGGGATSGGACSLNQVEDGAHSPVQVHEDGGATGGGDDLRNNEDVA
nr:putative glycine-rich cell wall structural protein 1 [Aegilops tauschii subsp. strangulata]